MRVLLVSTARQIGGAELYALRLVEALRSSCDFTMVMSDHSAMAPLREAMEEFARVVPLPIDRMGALMGVATQVRRLANESDVVQLISNHPASRLGILMGFVLGGLATPLVVVEQRATPVSDVEVPRALAPALPELFRRSRRRAGRIVAVSEENRRTLETVYGLPPATIEVVYNGADLSRFDGAPANGLRTELGLQPGQPVILSVARLLPNKGHRYLIEAAPAILGRLPGVHFVFAGDGEEQAALEAQIEAGGLGSHFSFLGFRPDVENLLHGADLFVLPSLAEGFALSLIEALAAGLPVVATDVGGAGEVIEDGRNGYLIPPADAPALADAVCRALAADSGERQAMSDAARATAARFSAQATAERMLAIYREVTTRHAGLS